tara:strand:+ start:89 stop:241 length:153 start_codon:yes stop_codon:yes gene_type:complete
MEDTMLFVLGLFIACGDKEEDTASAEETVDTANAEDTSSSEETGGEDTAE